MGRLEKNTAANLTGTIWSVGLGIVCIPLVIRFLGAEAFGLVGLFLTLQSICAILDLGIGATLNRELARFSANDADAREQRDLVFTLQAIYWLAAVAIGITIAALAPFVAGYWLKPHSLAVATVTTCVRMMGAAIAIQFPFVFYQAGMLGLQRHVLFNTLSAVIGTLRGPGILLLLGFVSRTPRMYFGAQIAVSAIATSAGALMLWRLLPEAAAHRCRFRRDLLRRVWRFGAAYSANSLANLALLQGDKIILSGVLPLEMFGYYTLAQRLAGGLYAIIIAIDGAIFPRFSAAVATNDELQVASVYHRASQIMTVLLVPPAVIAALFSREVLMLWTHDVTAVRNTHIVLTLLACGMLLHAFAQAPFYLQWAYGWWRLISATNAVLLLTILPLYFVVAMRFGTVGAGVVWLLLNIGYVSTVPLMHRRLLRGEQRRWIINDVCVPLIGSLIVAGAAYWLMPSPLGTLQTIFYLGTAALATTVAAAALSPEIRALLLPRLRRAQPEAA
jgi:O-antigen/teichoic acid export membrane protein